MRKLIMAHTSVTTKKYQTNPVLRQAISFVLLVIMCIIATGCQPTETLKFQVAIGHIRLKLVETSESTQSTMIITSVEEIASSSIGVEYPQAVLDYLTKLDYAKSFAIFFSIGEVNKADIVREILRSGNQVTIRLSSFSIGPGNYGFPGLTSSYQLLVIEKPGTWGENIHFTIKADDNGVISQTSHFVP